MSYYLVFVCFITYLSHNKHIMRFVRFSEEKLEQERLYKISPNSVVRNRCLSLFYSNEEHSIKEVSSLIYVFLSKRSIFGCCPDLTGK